MNKPEPKVPFVMSVFNPNEGDNGFMLNTSPSLISFIIDAGIEDMFEINRISPSRALMVVNPCYDANEARAYLEALLTEADAVGLAAGGEETAAQGTEAREQELLVKLGYYTDVLEEIKEAAKQGANLNYIIKVIEGTLAPRATAAAPETSDGDAGAGSGEQGAGE